MKQITCHACSAKFDVSSFPSGKKFRCGRCKEILTVPEDMLADELMEEPMPEPEPVAAEAGAEEAVPDLEGGGVATETEAEPEPAPRPAARGASGRGALSSRGRDRRPSARKPAAIPDDEGGEPLPQKMSPLPKILAAVIVLAILGGGGFFAWKRFGKGGGTSGDGAAAVGDEYARRLKKLEKSSGLENLRLALWCKSKGLEKYDFHLKEALRLSPNDPQVRSGAAESYWAHSTDKAGGTAAECLAAAESAKQAGMEGERKRQVRRATTIEPENAAAWEALGCVRYEPEGGPARWMLKAEAEKARIAEQEHKDAVAKVAGMSPREKTILELRQGLANEFGPDFVFRDEKPYLFCMQKSDGYSAELVMDSYITELKAFYQRFFDRFGEKFKLGDLREQVMLIWIFKSREDYFKYGANIGIPPNAGGHWEPGKERLMIFHSTDSARADPYGTIFHETTHMIMYFATKLRGKPSGTMFWFTEGLATYFEPFERDKATGKITQQVGTLNTGRLGGIRQWLGINRHVKLKELFGMTYQEFSQENGRRAAKGDPNWGAFCYSEVWSVLYFFYNYENGKYAEKFEKYFQEELDGSPGMDTFKKIFGDDFDSMEKEWSAYTKSLK